MLSGFFMGYATLAGFGPDQPRKFHAAMAAASVLEAFIVAIWLLAPFAIWSAWGVLWNLPWMVITATGVYVLARTRHFAGGG